MMLKRSTTKSKPSALAGFVRAGVAGLAAAGAVAALATGCLDRPVAKVTPQTSNLFVSQLRQTAVDKIDLLFMIDNSVSMADKQEILKAAVPVLVTRLITPICLNPTTGEPDPGVNSVNGKCANGGSPEFNPINDIHIGIVSSSLGGHGGTVCSSGAATDTLDDKARLVGSNRGAALLAKSWNNSGFLAWDPLKNRNTPPGTDDAGTLNSSFQDMIVATGEHGCGYEASLESWYRFLVDPEPPANVTLMNGSTVRGSSLALDTSDADHPKVAVDANGATTCTGCDNVVLQQRAAFLRPDSLVAIIMLSDENDCSIRDDGVGWFVGSNARMPRATQVCDTNPNDKCCRSCAQNEKNPPDGCAALSADPVCKTVPAGQQYATWDAMHDMLNLRCYNQHKRFGFDLLYPTQRYVDALSKPTVALQSNPRVSVTNPLFATGESGAAPRPSSLVFLAGIVGVPWQDIATDDSLSGAGLTYLTAQELSAKDRWTALLGQPGASPPTLPTDPFMVEQVDPRSGTNSIAKVAIVDANSTNPHANVINGHEQKIPNQDDLQYACTFPLTTPKTCMKNDNACDCSPDGNGNSQGVMDKNSPLCQGGATINTQTSAKAYPGARELQVLKDFGDNAIVASICPKISDTKSADYGYNPAVGAIIERLKVALQGKCLPRPIGTDTTKDSPTYGQVLCKVIEAQKSGCDCANTPGRAHASDQIASAVQAQLETAVGCKQDEDQPGIPACKSWCQCEITQLTGDDQAACQSNRSTNPGYCYIDAQSSSLASSAGDKAAIDAQLAKCPSNQQQLLRFVDSGSTKTPAQGAIAFIACLGAPVVTVDGGT